MALLQESSKQVEEINNMSTSKQVEESSKEVEELSESSKQVEESSESKISISERLWKNCANEALYFWYSPLFVHMSSGSLDDKEFYEFVANYAHLLNNFLEVYNLAADQCEDDSDQAAFLGWSKNVKQELERHNSIVEQKLGLDPTRETTLHTATAKYKEFLLATASGDIQGHEIPVHQSKIPAYTLGAMTPSLRLYAFLSKAVRELVTSDDTSHPHSKWIKEYSYENFKTSYLHATGVFTGEVTRQAHQSVTATLEYFEDMVQENEKFILTLSELQLATNSFYKANLPGEGSAGSFCKAQFTDGQIFAARVVDTVALSLHEEHFFNIIQNVSRHRHPNIITFTGYCLENGQRVRLHSWALDYMHPTSSPPANNNLQTANVLLDDEFMPRLCDSGLAVLRPFTGNNTHLKASDSTKDYILVFATAPKGSGVPPFKYGRMFPRTPPKQMPAYLRMPRTTINAAVSSSSQGSIKPKEKKWPGKKWFYICGKCRSKVAAEDESERHPYIQRAIIISPHPPTVGEIMFPYGPPLLFCLRCRWWLGFSLLPGPDWIVFASQLQMDFLM